MKNIKAFVITLNDPKNKQNSELFSALIKNGFDVEFIDGINGKELSASDYFTKLALTLTKTDKLPTPSEIGCTLSHQCALKKIINSKYPYAVILEDDVIVNNLNSDVIYKLLSKINTPDYFIHLGGQDGLEKLARNSHGNPLLENPPTWSIYTGDIDRIVRTVGYLISFNTAKKMCEIINESYPIIDDFPYFYKLGAFRRFIFSNIVKHPYNLTNSTIQPERNLIHLYNSSRNMNTFFKFISTYFLTKKSRIKYKIDTSKMENIDL